MKPADQEKLFAVVKKHWPDWDNRTASGYVKGVVDGLRLDEPDRKQIAPLIEKGVMPSRRELEYMVPYMQGFADVHGVGFADWWAPLITSREEQPDRWWEHDEIFAEA